MKKTKADPKFSTTQDELNNISCDDENFDEEK